MRHLSDLLFIYVHCENIQNITHYFVWWYMYVQLLCDRT